MIAHIQENKCYSPEEYLAFEVDALERHQYINGEIILMPGGTPNHNKITLNLSSHLNFALKRQPYEVFVTDQRLWIPERRIYTYPDVMVMAQPLEYAENRRDTLTNPLMIAEVLSSSNRNYDKDGKFAAYRTIPSFQEYILIDKYTMQVEQYTHRENHPWILSQYHTPESIISLTSFGLEISLADLYDKVDFLAENERTENLELT